MILIAESKTMTSEQQEVSPEEFKEHRPLYDEHAEAIMDSLRNHTIGQLAAKAGITNRLAESLRHMIYEFPNKSLGIRAVDAFTGVVFRQLGQTGYDDVQRLWLNGNLRIISSLYGWLRPDDIIKPYRLDFKSRVAPDGDTLMKYWKKDVTIALVKELRMKGDNVIIDLLPSDAAKCIDWKLVKRFAKVYKVDFKTVVSHEELKTPNSGRLKELRGRLLDHIIRLGITTPSEIASLESPDYMPAPSGLSISGSLSFITA